MKLSSLFILSMGLLTTSIDAKIRGSVRVPKTVVAADRNRDLKSDGKSMGGSSMSSSYDGKKHHSKGKKGSSDGWDPYDGPANLGVGECEICSKVNKIRPNSITFRYTSASANSRHQTRSTCVARSTPFPQTAQITTNGQNFQVSDGQTFTVFGAFEANTDVFITNDNYSCVLHTSCSQPLVAGDRFGPLQVVGDGDTCTGTWNGCSNESQCGNSGTGDPPTGGSSSNPYPNGDCEICSKENKVRPQRLTLQYRSQGQNSAYQDKSTCLAGNYPSSAQIQFAVDDLQVRTINVVDGFTFNLEGPFEANTDVSISGFGTCVFHTSCSQPLVAGDQIGPFIILAGGQCDENRPIDPPSGGLSPTPPAPTPPGPPTNGYCEICSKQSKVRPDSLTLQYLSNGKTSDFQNKDSNCVGGTYPAASSLQFAVDDFQVRTVNVVDGSIFTIDGDFEANTDVLISGWGECGIHTSCSQPLVAGDQIGPFLVIGGGRCDARPPVDPPSGGLTPTPPPPTPPGPGNCEICSKQFKVRPDALTLQYLSDGKTSLFQDKDSNCVGGFYPSASRLQFAVDDFVVRTIDVANGDIFTVDGPFEANTNVLINGWGECGIHTSCSQPLVAGDQIGPFLVIGGGRCGVRPTPPPVDPPSGGLTPTPPPPSPPAPFSQPTPVPLAPTPTDDSCRVCSPEFPERPDVITLQYFSDGNTSNYQPSATCVAGPYPQSANIQFAVDDFAVRVVDVFDGMIFSIDGPFEDNTRLLISGFGPCTFVTSCSEPLVVGDQIGPFVVIGGGRCETGPAPSPVVDPPSGGSSPTPPAPTPTDENCQICNSGNMDTPDSLTLVYLEDGMNSLYQSQEFASCTMGMYPSSTVVTVITDGREQTFAVQDGAEFTAEGSFSATTTFMIVGWGECTIHTSCSVPLVVGDQIGPFLIVAGNDCGIDPTPIPTPSPTPLPTAGPTPEPTPSPIVNPTPSPIDPPTGGTNNTPSPTPFPTAGPTPEPTPLPTTGPTPEPTPLPTPAPTPAPTDMPSSSSGKLPPPTPPPVVQPTPQPTPLPTFGPTPEPTPLPTMGPTPAPTFPPIPPTGSTRTDPPTPSPTVGPTPEPTPLPTPPPTPDPTPAPTKAPTPAPTFPATPQPTDSSPTGGAADTPAPTLGPTPEPTPAPTLGPTPEPTPAPTVPIPCIRQDQITYNCADTITIDFTFDNAYPDDWIGIYPCDTTIYLHSEVWQWACGAGGCTTAVTSGTVVFDGLPTYNANGPHTWPIAPYIDPDNTLNRCFKAVYLREDGPSVPPYVHMCESVDFNIMEDENIAGCSIRPDNENVIGEDD